MNQSVSLRLSDKAIEQLNQLSQQLGISRDEFATICLETVDTQQQQLLSAVEQLRQQKKANLKADKKDLSRHLKQLSAEQIELLLVKAASRNKN